MPFAIDEDKMQSKPTPGQDSQVLVALDPHHPPVKSIPHLEFPRAVYKHPLEPFTTIEHRNARHELVEEEIIPTEHLTRVVADEKELKAAVADGWELKPYVPKAPPDSKAHLYDKKTK